MLQFDVLMFLFETNLILIHWSNNKLNNLTGHIGSSNNISFTYTDFGEGYSVRILAGIVSIVAFFVLSLILSRYLSGLYAKLDHDYSLPYRF
jgi:hypothetical protein